MIFKHSVPILYSSDIVRSLEYYTGVIGFEHKWEWDDPPSFGGVSKNSVEIFFCKDGQGHPGTWLALMVDDVDDLYEKIKAKGAQILSAPENMQWGIREMLVKDPDDHIIRFGQGAPVPDRAHTAASLPPTVKIVKRMATAKEKKDIEASMGWVAPRHDHAIERSALPAVVFGVVAEESVTGKAIGCAFILGDKAGFYYIKDLMVNPAWQNRHVGTAIMHSLMDWLEANSPDYGSAWLHCAERLAPFYRQFGFVPSFGMYRQFRKG